MERAVHFLLTKIRKSAVQLRQNSQRTCSG